MPVFFSTNYFTTGNATFNRTRISNVHIQDAKMQFCSAFLVIQTVTICLRVLKENNKNNWMSYFLRNIPKFKSVMKLRVSVGEAHIWSTTGIRHPMKNAIQTCEKCRLLQTWHCFIFWMVFFSFITKIPYRHQPEPKAECGEKKLFHVIGLRLFPFNLVSFLYEFSFFLHYFQPAVRIEIVLNGQKNRK